MASEVSKLMQAARERVIARGVEACHEFGWPAVTKENILTDRVYSMFFRGTLVDSLRGHGTRADQVLQSIIDDIDAAQASPAED